MRHPGSILVLLLAAHAPAAAAPKGTMICTDANKVQLPSAKLKKVETTIACGFMVKGYKGDPKTLTATVWATWGKGSALKSGEANSTETATVQGDTVLLVPPALAAGKGFPACESFALEGQVADSQGPVFKKKIAINQRCDEGGAGAPAPKLKAKLRCQTSADDGTIFRYPGNGTRKRPRVTNDLSCSVAIAKMPAGVEVKGSIKAGGAAHQGTAQQGPDRSWEVDAVLAPGKDFEECATFTVAAELTVAGTSVWKGSLPVKQDCSD